MITGLRTEPRAAMIGAQRLPLSPTESKVLQLIINAGDTPISRSALEERLYGGARRKSNTVEVTICRLRQKLTQHGYRINATRSRGYTISQAGAA
ncbi:helix-turn-helix domain-containing protein [Stenotrophomonas maltophilia]|uniref:helix-turn-helix domain-containing protein n=1 Tax=Stenotrophomonas maltophilia TaxID=40324 RepID=UPI00338DC37F